MKITSITETTAPPTFPEVTCWFNSNMSNDVIDFDDQKVYSNVYHQATKRTPGVFQLTSGGAQRLFKIAKPKSLVDIATLTSIYRPGPLAAKVDKLYLEARANPGAIDYKHPLIKQVLEPTFACIIFQEQIMSLCHVVAGFPKSECDKVRKAILKRQGGSPEESMKKANAMKQGFVDGAVKNGVKEEIASKLWEDILFFCGYGFNLSHAISYAMDSYYCAWLFTYYEAEWLCAYMESMIGNSESRAKAIAEIKSFDYEVGRVDINESSQGWVISKTRKAFVPSFSTLKSVGNSAINEIIQHRPYTDVKSILYDDRGIWKASKFNRRALDALIKMGAFESLGIVGEGRFFSSYKHMHHCIIENQHLIRKSLKRDPQIGWKKLNEIAIETYGMEEWTRRELAMFQKDVIGSVDAVSLIPQDVKERLEKNEILSTDNWTALDLYWFVIKSTTVKKTKKGKPYLLLDVVGESGIAKRMYMWDWDMATEFEPYTACIGEVDSSEFGLSIRLRKMKILA